MKRHGNLYEKIYDINNLRLAHKNAKKGKGWYKEVKEIDSNLDYYLYKLQDMLINKTYNTSEYEIFLKKDINKVREIYKLPYFPDRICQWAILQVIEPYLIKTFTSDTYSAIPNRGIQLALQRIKKDIYLNSDKYLYCLKIDARKYYPSINHNILKSKYRKLFKDKDLLWLLDEIIDSAKGNVGIPIGNYLSQYSGNFYFSSFDHWIKEEKRVKYYYRYMDDIVIINEDKNKLKNLLKEIDLYFKNNLELTIKDNYQIFPVYKRGIDFLGYRIFKDFILLRKGTCNRMKRKMVYILEKCKVGQDMTYSEWCSINSYKGWLKYCNSYRLYEKYIKPLNKYYYEFYNKNIKSKKRRKMKKHEKCRSTTIPTDIEILESKVFTYENIIPYEENIDNIIMQGYEFDMCEYEKDEYIQEISKKNDNLENQIIDTQIALCDIYESIKG